MSEKRTIQLGGREYELISSRIERFRTDHPTWSIWTEVKPGENSIFAKASIADDEGRVIATGHAELSRAIAKQATCEKAESKSVGRALAFLGYLGGGEFASAEEMENITTHAGRR